MARDNSKALWITPPYAQFMKKIAAYLNKSIKEVTEQAILDYAGRHPELSTLWEEFQTSLKEDE